MLPLHGNELYVFGFGVLDSVFVTLLAHRSTKWFVWRFRFVSIFFSVKVTHMFMYLPLARYRSFSSFQRVLFCLLGLCRYFFMLNWFTENFIEAKWIGPFTQFTCELCFFCIFCIKKIVFCVNARLTELF